MSDVQPLLGGIELGGTKTVFAIGTPDGQVLARRSVPTRAPEAVIADAAAFFADSDHPLAALGVGGFGPIVIDRKAPAYGTLGETNKHGWSHFDLIGALARAVPVPTGLVTDVGAAALAEARFGALKGRDIGVYLTVGTGIGGAIIAGGRVLPSLLHPEMGHITLQRSRADSAPSTCAFHADCAEGLAAGPAILARFGRTLADFASSDTEFLLIADYLGQLGCQLVLTLSPQRIVLGGGVGGATGLVPAVHAAMLRHLGRYAPSDIAQEGYLTAPALGPDAGVIGALICAAEAIRARA